MIAAGTLIEGRYRIDRLVGQGGFGSVYAGVQLSADLQVAIKVLRLGDDISMTKRADKLSHFVEEARMLGRLRHDCIVRTIDQGIMHDATGATPYLVMEWGGEETLRNLLDSMRGQPLALDAAWPLFHGMVDGMAHAHALGVAHRDLKPSNVMLLRGSDGGITPRLIDFGIAKLFDDDEAAGSGQSRTRSGSSAFTPAYAAPEQIAHARTGPWTDVHALALVFVEMVTGHAPYGNDGSEGLAAIDPLRPTPRRFGVEVGPFEGALATALALRPAERYREAGVFLAALNRAAADAGLGEVTAASVRFPRGGIGVSLPASPIASPPQTTGLPSSHTVPSGPVAPVAPSPRLTSRRILIAAAGLTAVAGIGAAVLAASTPSRRASKGREPDDDEEEPETPERSSSPAKTPSSLQLIGLTADNLEARTIKAGFSVQMRNELANPRQILLTIEREGVYGALNLIDMLLPRPDLAGAELEAMLMPYVGTIVRNYRETSMPGIVYAFSERTLLLIAWKLDARLVGWFDSIVSGLAVSVKGNTISGPDPASRAAPARVEAPGATRLSELTSNELRNRMLKPGAVSVQEYEPGAFMILYGPNGAVAKAATVKLFAPPPTTAAGAGDKYLAALVATKKPHSFAKDGAAVIVCEGSPGFDCTAFMKLVLEKLPVDVKSAL